MHPTRTVAGQDRSFLNSYVVKGAEDDLNGWHCTICGKSNTQKCNVISHVESAHFAGTFLYTCSYCSKEMKTKNALNIHVRRDRQKRQTDKKLVRLPFKQYDGLFEIQIGTIETINYSAL